MTKILHFYVTNPKKCKPPCSYQMHHDYQGVKSKHEKQILVLNISINFPIKVLISRFLWLNEPLGSTLRASHRFTYDIETMVKCKWIGQCLGQHFEGWRETVKHAPSNWFDEIFVKKNRDLFITRNKVLKYVQVFIPL